MGSFLGVTVAGLFVVLGAGGDSSTLGGVYLRVLLEEGVLLCGSGTGVLLLLAGAGCCVCGG